MDRYGAERCFTEYYTRADVSAVLVREVAAARYQLAVARIGAVGTRRGRVYSGRQVARLAARGMESGGGATAAGKHKGVVALRPSADASQLVQAAERPAKKRPLPSEPYTQRGYLGDGPQQEAPPTAAELIRRPLGTFMAGTDGHEGLGKDKAYMADRIESHWLAMAGSEDKQKQLAKLMPPPAARPKKKRRKHEVLDEDTYVESLTKIITRDFFPDLPKLRQQVEVMDAIEANDLERLRELQARFSQQRSAERSMQRASSIRSVGATPFDTPGSAYDPTPSRDGGDYDAAGGAGQSADDVTNRQGTGDGAKPVDTALTLDAFHSKYTSEDNEAFVEILEKDQDKQWEKTKWFVPSDVLSDAVLLYRGCIITFLTVPGRCIAGCTRRHISMR